MSLVQRWGLACAAYALLVTAITVIRWAPDDVAHDFLSLCADAPITAIGSLGIACAAVGLRARHLAAEIRVSLVIIIAILIWIVPLAYALSGTSDAAWRNVQVAYEIEFISCFGFVAYLMMRPFRRIAPALITIGALSAGVVGAWTLTPTVSMQMFVGEIGPALETAAATRARKGYDYDTGIYASPPDMAAYVYDSPPLAVYRIGYILYDANDDTASDAAAKFTAAFFPRCAAQADRIRARFYDLRVLCD